MLDSFEDASPDDHAVPQFLLENHKSIFSLPSVTLAASEVGSRHNPQSLRCILGTSTGFVALTSRGDVYTWGDARFPHALGREVNSTAPAHKPSLVEELSGLSTVKIVTGGNTAAALTEGGDAFIWGMAALGSVEDDGRKDLQALLDIKEEGEHIAKISLPVLHNLDEALHEHGEDPEVVDVAIGDGHVLALDVDAQVWVCGANGHGQLGVAEQAVARAEVAGSARHWQLVDAFEHLKMNRGLITKSVYAGDLTSFVLTERVEW